MSTSVRPGVWRAPSSLTRSLVPATRQASRGLDAAIAGAASTPRGVSIMAQRARVSGAPAGASAASARATSLGRLDLGQQHRVGAGAGGRGEVVGAPRRAGAVHPDHHLALAVAARRHRRHHLAARLLLGGRRHRVLQVEEQHVGVEGAGLLQRPGVGAGHVEGAAARADGGHMAGAPEGT